MQDIDHATRITLLEHQQSEIRGSLKSLTDDMRQMATAMTQLAEDRAAYKRTFESIERLESAVVDIEARMDKHDQEALQAIIRSQAKELEMVAAHKRGMLAEVGRTVLIALGTVISGMILYHFGIRP